jgi:hypothetical protein
MINENSIGKNNIVKMSFKKIINVEVHNFIDLRIQLDVHGAELSYDLEVKRIS